MDDLTQPLDRDRSSPELRRYALDFAIRAYDEHKTHARFQEQQRSWILIAYLTFSGVLISTVTNNLQKEGYILESAKSVLILVLFFHLAVSVLVSLAVSKVSREFRRHFKHANLIVDQVRRSICREDTEAARLLDLCALGTAGDHLTGFSQTMAKRFGVAAVHNYLLSLFIGFDVGMIVMIRSGSTFPSVVVFIIVSAGSALLFTIHNKKLEVKAPEASEGS